MVVFAGPFRDSWGSSFRDDFLFYLDTQYSNTLIEDLRIVKALTLFAEASVQAWSMIESLQEADRNKDQFMISLAHELRNPLAPIVSGLEVLIRLDTGLDPQTAAPCIKFHIAGVAG